MGVELRGITAVNPGQGSFYIPAATQVGDLIIVDHGQYSSVPTTPSDDSGQTWTALAGVSGAGQYTDQHYLWWRTAVAGDAGRLIQLQSTVTQYMSAFVVVLYGHHPTNTIHQQNAVGGAGSPIHSGGINTTVATRRLYFFSQMSDEPSTPVPTFGSISGATLLGTVGSSTYHRGAAFLDNAEIGPGGYGSVSITSDRAGGSSGVVLAIRSNNNAPNPPSGLYPNGVAAPSNQPITVGYTTYSDPEGHTQGSKKWRWRTKAGPGYAAGPWNESAGDGSAGKTFTLAAGTWADGTEIEFQFAVADSLGTWSDWSTETAWFMYGAGLWEYGPVVTDPNAATTMKERGMVAQGSYVAQVRVADSNQDWSGWSANSPTFIYEPTTVVAAVDSVAVGITEESATHVSFPASDAVGVGITESTAIFVAVAASDSLSVGVTESRTLSATVSAADAPALAVADSGAVQAGPTASDAPSLSLLDATEDKGEILHLFAEDTPTVSLIDSPTMDPKLRNGVAPATTMDNFTQFDSLVDGGFYTDNYYGTLFSNDFIEVDSYAGFEIAAEWRGAPGIGQKHYVGYAPYDEDYLLVSVYMVNQVGQQTVLTAPLAPGDTVVQVENPAGWNNAGSGGQRTLALYPYVSPRSGHVYTPDQGYTRNVKYDSANGAWPAGGISGGTITLTNPWDLPNPNTEDGIWPVGTVVADHSTGSGYAYSLVGNEALTDDNWQSRRVKVLGNMPGNFNFNARVWPGTKYVKLLILSNREIQGGGTVYRNLYIDTPALYEAYRREVLVDSPAAYWRLGDPTGSEAVDISGNRNHGLIEGSVQRNQPSPQIVDDSEGSMGFPNNSGDEKHVELPASSCVVSQTAGWAWECWIRPPSQANDLDANPVIMGESRNDTSGNLVCLLYGSGGANVTSLRFYCTSGANQSYTPQLFGTILREQWSHLVLTFDGENLYFYVNGEQRGSTSATTWKNHTYNSFNVGSIGALRRTGWTNGFSGHIDEVSKYTKYLTQEDITRHYEASFASRLFDLTALTERDDNLVIGVDNSEAQWVELFSGDGVLVGIKENTFPAGMDFESGLPALRGGMSEHFTLSADSARTGGFGLAHASNATHGHVFIHEADRRSGTVVAEVWARVDLAGTHLGGLVFGGLNSTTGYQIMIDSRSNPTAASSAGFQLRENNSSVPLARDNAVTIIPGTWYRVQGFWGSNGDVVGRLYDEAGNLISEISVYDMSYVAGKVGIHAYQAMSFDDFSFTQAGAEIFSEVGSSDTTSLSVVEVTSVTQLKSASDSAELWLSESNLESVILKQGPVVYWQVDEPSLVGETVIDSSGNDHHATYFGYPSDDYNEETESVAVALGGGTWASGPSYTGPNFSQGFSGSFWMKAPTNYEEIWNGYANQILRKGTAGHPSSVFAIYLFGNTSAAGLMRLYGSPGGSWGTLSPARTIPKDGLWHHYAVTYDSVAGAAALYIDGAPWGSGTGYPTAPLPDNTDPIQASGWSNSSMDEVAVFNRPLTAQEVADQYAASVANYGHKIAASVDVSDPLVVGVFEPYDAFVTLESSDQLTVAIQEEAAKREIPVWLYLASHPRSAALAKAYSIDLKDMAGRLKLVKTVNRLVLRRDSE